MFTEPEASGAARENIFALLLAWLISTLGPSRRYLKLCEGLCRHLPGFRHRWVAALEEGRLATCRGPGRTPVVAEHFGFTRCGAR